MQKEKSEAQQRSTIQNLKLQWQTSFRTSMSVMLTNHAAQAAEVRSEEQRMLDQAKKALMGAKRTTVSQAENAKTREERKKKARAAKQARRKLAFEEKRKTAGLRKLESLGQMELIMLEKAKQAQSADEKVQLKLRTATKQRTPNLEAYLQRVQDIKQRTTQLLHFGSVSHVRSATTFTF